MKNNGTKKFGNNDNFRPRKSKEEYEAEKAAQIAKQTKSLEIIDAVAEYLDNFLTKGEGFRVSMKDLLTYLNTEKGFSADDTKVTSQFNYLMTELANSRKNTRISGDRLNIRVMYIEERFKTSFKSELHDKVREIINTHTTLFAWDDSATAENYNTLEKE